MPSSTAKNNNPVTDYARKVLSGEIVAGPYVRGECKRHLDDLRKGAARGIRFDADEAQFFIDFFETVLTVEAGDVAIPFKLLDWQAFVIGSIFGWKYLDPDLEIEVRRFQTAYIETGKGSGKSPLAAGVGLACMLADGVASAEVYAAATIKPQAMILFNDATKMIKRSPALKKRLVKSGGNPIWQWTHLKTASIFKPLSKDEAVSGPRPNCALIDEYHEHKTSDTLDMLEAGFKGRTNPLLFVITNSGSDLATPCGEMHEWSCEVSTGEFDEAQLEAADRFFSFITALDKKDDPLNDESCWIKANPSLGHTIKPSYLRKQVATAKAMPARQNKILRLNFCKWTDAATAWLTREAWEAVEVKEDLFELNKGKIAYCGLDLSYTQDMSALATVWPYLVDGVQWYDVAVDLWKPEVGLQVAADRDKVPYPAWAEAGHLRLTTGKVIKLSPIAQRMAWAQKHYDLQAIAYDAYRHKEMQDDLDRLGIELPMLEHPQGFRRVRTKDTLTGETLDNPLWMPGSCQEIENAIVEGRIRFQFNRVLRWNVSSAVVKTSPGSQDDWIFDKKKATRRIDGIVAAAMGVGAAKTGHKVDQYISPWEDPEFKLEPA